MKITDHIKTLNKKIIQNEAQCDLDRKAAKISALPSNNLDKYKHLTGEDLGLKLRPIEQTKSIHHWVTLPLIVCNYLKSLNQEAKDLMDELEDANNDIGYNKLLYIGDKEKFNFNIFSIPLNFLLDIVNGK